MLPRDLANYRLLRLIARGGMGEVYLAENKELKRVVALKRIRTELFKHKVIRDRFMREARVASKLCHPSIIPIYWIHDDTDELFYTMPYIEGETLKQILRTTHLRSLRKEPPHPIGSSVNSLVRIFLNICQAIAHTHSKGILHRDIKPENIIVGKFGEVMLLDWGLADKMGNEDVFDLGHDEEELTRPGKIVGTVSYMAPERAKHEPCSIQTEVYALGVILYQLLALRMPFRRGKLKEFMQIAGRESVTPPEQVAPYRDVPRQLSRICLKCLQTRKERRYKDVNALIADIETYIQGRPDWSFDRTLDIHRKSDWEFQEHIMMSRKQALAHATEMSTWVTQMISKEPFPIHVRLEMEICCEENSDGIGILLAVPEPGGRKRMDEGYLLCLRLEEGGTFRIYRSNALVMKHSNIGLTPGKRHSLLIEKTYRHLRFYFDGQLITHYISQVPFSDPYIGFAYRDNYFELSPMRIHVGSKSATVSCLAVPDALLEEKNYAKALIEYRRIAGAFPGRIEGRDASFRAGVTLLQEALSKRSLKARSALCHEALEEFEKLHATPGEPFEYLGKSLVYKELAETEEEIKCLELAIRKFPNHPERHVLIEQVIFRLQECAHKDRIGAYRFALLTLRQLPEVFDREEHQHIYKSLKEHIQPLPFIQEVSVFSSPKLIRESIALQLAFWLNKPLSLIEILEHTPCDKPDEKILRSNAVYCLVRLGEKKHALRYASDLPFIELLLTPTTASAKKFLDSTSDLFIFQNLRILFTILWRALVGKNPEMLLPILEEALARSMADETRHNLEELHAWTYLMMGRHDKAREVAPKKRRACLNYLLDTERKLPEYTPTPFPKIGRLFAQHLRGELGKRWRENSFRYERERLKLQLKLIEKANQ